MLREALDFPTSGDHGPRALLVGSLLLLVVAGSSVGAGYAADTGRVPLAVAGAAVAVLPLVAVRGYYYRAIATATTQPDPVAPAFGGVGRLLWQGVIAIAVGLAYLLPSGLLFTAAAGAATLPGRDGQTVDLLTQSLGAVASLFGIVSLLAALYLTPAAIAALAHGNGIRAAFQLREIAARTATEDYVVGWIVATALQWTLGLVASVLSTLVIGLVLYFLTAVATRYVWGISFRAATGVRSVPKEGITPSNRPRAEAGLHEMVLNAGIDDEDTGGTTDENARDA